jgi:hypothetical protein
MNEIDHAVSSSTTYLIRSLGGVWGVAITSKVVQNIIRIHLEDAFSEIPDKEKVRILGYVTEIWTSTEFT